MLQKRFQKKEKKRKESYVIEFSIKA